jgi:hypothetical protein
MEIPVAFALNYFIIFCGGNWPVVTPMRLALIASGLIFKIFQWFLRLMTNSDNINLILLNSIDSSIFTKKYLSIFIAPTQSLCERGVLIRRPLQALNFLAKFACKLKSGELTVLSNVP